MSSKKKRKLKAGENHLEALKRQMQKNGTADKFAGFTKVEGPKLSEVFLEFIAPFSEHADTDEAYRKLVTTAAFAWNIAVSPKAEQQKLSEVFVNTVVGMAGEEWRKDTRDVLMSLVRRKKLYFASDKRYIVDYRLTDTGKGYHLAMASVVQDQPK
jgi:hypothetical protein